MFEQLKNPGSGWETMKSLLSALSITACTITAAATTGGTAISSAQAQSFQPAIVFDMGGKFDKSFNEAAYVGAERFKKETGIEYREFEVTQEAQREQALRTMARRGANVVVGVGFAQASAMERFPRNIPTPSSASSTAWWNGPTSSPSLSRNTKDRSWSA